MAAPGGSQSPGADLNIDQRREVREARRRQANASPGENGNRRNSEQPTGAHDAVATTPTRSVNRDAGQDMGLRGSGEDYSVQRAERSARRQISPSPDPRRMSGLQSPSEAGSEGNTPTRRSRVQFGGVVRSNSQDSFAFGSKRKENAQGGPRRHGPDGSGELLLAGEIKGATGFAARKDELLCRWQLIYDPSKSWQVLAGLQQGATHAATISPYEDECVVWEHPLQIQMQTKSLQGWPSLLLMVFSRDWLAQKDKFVSYGLCSIPNVPGAHSVTCETWYGLESNNSLGARFFEWHTGMLPRLEDETFITDMSKREDAGPFVCTVGAGRVHLRLNVLLKNFMHISHKGGESVAKSLERLTTDILRMSTRLANQKAAIEEFDLSRDMLTDGQRMVRETRDDRRAQARSIVEARRRGDSPLHSDAGSRRPSFDPSGRAGMQASPMPSEHGEAPSDRSVDGAPGTAGTGSGSNRFRDRYGDRMARLARERADSSRGGGSEAGTGSQGVTPTASRRPTEAGGVGQDARASGGAAAGGGVGGGGASGSDAELTAEERRAKRSARRAAGQT